MGDIAVPMLDHVCSTIAKQASFSIVHEILDALSAADSMMNHDSHHVPIYGTKGLSEAGK